MKRKLMINDFVVVRESGRIAYVPWDNLRAVLGPEFSDLESFLLTGQCLPEGIYAHDVARWIDHRVRTGLRHHDVPDVRRARK
jgi:hypothetical protein